ncbi:MAG: alpha/beta hydrolase [Methyloligellaceae bacterium]
MFKILAVTILVILVLLLLMVLVLFYQQRKFIYFPEKVRTSPAAAGLSNVAEITLVTPDKHKLIAWYSRAAPGKPTILYFHGNGGSLRSRTERVMLMQQKGYGLFMLSYRGYGGSSGSPSERKIIGDALLAYQWLVDNRVSDRDIILYGESLGTGVATQVASLRNAACLILEAPFTSLPDIARISFPYLPTRFLMKDQFDSARHISKISQPLLILHGSMDTVIPVAYGQQLFDLARSPKSIEVFPFGAHSDLYLHGAWSKVTEFMEQSCVNY